MNQPRAGYLLGGLAVVLIGVASRSYHTGLVVLDKYLGDALYAVLVYLLLSIARPSLAHGAKAGIAAVLVAAIELFQVTGIPAGLARSGNLLLRAGAIVLGTSFSWYDMLAYAVGILLVYLIDRGLARTH